MKTKDDIEHVVIIKDCLLRSIALTGLLSRDGIEDLIEKLYPPSQFTGEEHEKELIQAFMNYVWKERKITHGY
jgi:hypothetical protein